MKQMHGMIHDIYDAIFASKYCGFFPPTEVGAFILARQCWTRLVIDLTAQIR